MKTTEKWVGDVRSVIYPIQFEPDPRNGVDRVVGQVVEQQTPDLPPEQILLSVRQALASDLDLSQLLPQDHSDQKIRDYLGTLERRLTGFLQQRIEDGSLRIEDAPQATTSGTLARSR